MLAFLGRFGKGYATLLGAIVTLAPMLFPSDPGKGTAIANLAAFLRDNSAAFVTVLGAVIAAFGFGRKAGTAANTPPAAPPK